MTKGWTKEQVADAVKESIRGLRWNLENGKNYSPVYGGKRILKELIKLGYREYKQKVVGANGIELTEQFFQL